MIPYGKHEISEADISEVVKVLHSDFLTQGDQVKLFEDSISKACKSNYAVAVNSATSALHLACLSLDLGPGDLVWTTPISFVATANAAIYCGASVDFVDIDPYSYNISVSLLEQKLLQTLKIGGSLPKIVIAVHLAGQSADMEKIFQLGKKFNFKIIEDASHAIGATYKNEPVGSCNFSDITVFSFHPVKIITTGEGGILTTNDSCIAERASLMRSHGIIRDPNRMINEFEGPWYYEQTILGFNYRLTDIQAALGTSQLKSLKKFIMRRREIAARYSTTLNGSLITLPKQDSSSESSWHLYIVRLKLDEISLSHQSVFNQLRQLGIQVNLHYIPIYRHPFYMSQYGDRSHEFMNSESYYSEAISLPIYTTLTNEDQSFVINSLNSILRN